MGKYKVTVCLSSNTKGTREETLIVSAFSAKQAEQKAVKQLQSRQDKVISKKTVLDKS